MVALVGENPAPNWTLHGGAARCLVTPRCNGVKKVCHPFWLFCHLYIVMMTTRMIPVSANDDVELVNASLDGNRDAFGMIVARYQSLICSLAYSATGSLGQSEDLAQETFLAAWRELARLRERDKFRAWLCGIARNRINNFLRREGREPVCEAGPLEQISESHAPGLLPLEQTINNEEAAILWRSLERVPELYREPLVLFYREHQSIEAVAEKLELTEDAVKQRLSRGRKLLHKQVLAFVEGALERTNPGKAFTIGVLAAMPALTYSAKAATAGVVAKSSAAAKTAGVLPWLGMCLGPLIVLLPNYLGYLVALAGAQSEEERAGIKSFFGKVGGITVALFIPFAAVVLWWSRNQTDHSYLSGVFATGLVLFFVPAMFIIAARSGRQNRAYVARVLAEKHAGVFPPPTWEYRSRACLLGLPLVHIRIGDRFAVLKQPVRAWIAVGNAAIGGLFALGGMAIAPVSLGGLSIGLLSFGGVAAGVVALGGIAAGVWPLFGGLLIGWQAYGGCLTVAWNAAAGDFAFAHDFALGGIARALQANDEPARQFIEPNMFFGCSRWIARHWLWVNLLWAIPFFIQWQMARRSQRR